MNYVLIGFGEKTEWEYAGYSYAAALPHFFVCQHAKAQQKSVEQKGTHTPL